MKHRVIRLRSFALLGAVLWAAPALPSDPPAVRENVSVHLVRLPVLFEEKKPGACAGIEGRDIELREDGQAIEAVHIEPASLTTTHAVLIDTGSSMLENLAVAREATAAHVAALPANEPALLATFDDSLTLHAPLSTNRDHLYRSLEWIETASGKYIWDALEQMFAYLRPLPGRKVLLLITNGCDTQRVAAVSPESVIEDAGRLQSVAVFAIGVDLPETCPGTDTNPAAALRSLARETGGEFHALRTIGKLDAIMTRIRQRLDSERVLQYQPTPFGGGPKDRPEKQDHRYRRLDLDVRGVAGCKARLAGPSTRYSSAGQSLFGGGAEASKAGPVFKDEGGNRLAAEIVDIVADGGPPPGILITGVGPTGGPSRKRAPRRVQAFIPSLSHVVREDAQPENVVFNALAEVAREPLGKNVAQEDAKPETWSDVPFLVNGRTLLDARRALARGLLDHPEYGRWAFTRVIQTRLATMDELVKQAGTPDLRDALVAARESMTHHSWVPEPEELESQLGAWLGDVRAPLLFNAAEVWLASRLWEHASVERLGQLAPAAAESERLWHLVGQWFPSARDVRVLGILLPGYDAERQQVGFYRVSLKQSTAFAINATLAGLVPNRFLDDATDESESSLYSRLGRWNYSREAPLGARMVRWMIEQRRIRPVMERLTLTSIRYATSSNRDLGALLESLRFQASGEDRGSYPARLVTLTVADREDPAQHFDIHAYFPTLPGNSQGYADAPGCVVFPDKLPESGLGFELFGALLGAKKSSDFPCVFQTAADSQAPSAGQGR